jgi:pyruvate-formate lyase-activating enzyme
MGSPTIPDFRAIPDFRDLAITDLADEGAQLREANRTLVDLLADVVFENHVLHQELDREVKARLRRELATEVGQLRDECRRLRAYIMRQDAA